MTILLDTREPSPHPWERFLPDGWRIESGKLETGDVALARLPEGIVIERKTASDLAGCIGSSRERFERELKRSRYIGRFIVVCEGDLRDVCTAARGMHHSVIMGTLASWTARYCPFVFAGSAEAAANFSFRALSSQVRDIQRQNKALIQKNEP